MGIHQTLVHIGKAHEGREGIAGVTGADKGKADLTCRVGHKQLQRHGVQVGNDRVTGGCIVADDGREGAVCKGYGVRQHEIALIAFLPQSKCTVLLHAFPDHQIFHIGCDIGLTVTHNQAAQALFDRGVALVLRQRCPHCLIGSLYLFRLQLFHKVLAEPVIQCFSTLHGSRPLLLRTLLGSLTLLLRLFCKGGFPLFHSGAMLFVQFRVLLTVFRANRTGFAAVFLLCLTAHLSHQRFGTGGQFFGLLVHLQ